MTELVTKREAANLLGVSLRTLERRIAAGELQAAGRERLAGRGPRRIVLDASEVRRLRDRPSDVQLEFDVAGLGGAR